MSSSSDSRVPNLSRLSLVAGASRQPAPSPIDASLLSVGVGGNNESVLRLRYHEIIPRAIERIEWETVPPQINSESWLAWFATTEGNAYLDVESRLVPTKLALEKDKTILGRFTKTVAGIEFLMDGQSVGNTAIPYLKKLTEGTYVWQVRFGVSTPRPTQAVVLEGAAVEAEAEAGARARTNGPPSKRTRARVGDAGNEGDEGDEGDALTLRQEYFTHCIWLYLIQQPSHWSAERGTLAPNEVDSSKTFVTPIKLDELRETVLGKELLQTHVDIYGSDFDLPNVERSLYFLVESWKREKTLENLAPQLTRPMTAKVMQRWHKWLKAYTLSEVGTIYMTRPVNARITVDKYDDVGGAPKDAPDDAADAGGETEEETEETEKETETGELKGLTVEHITPISWTRDTRLLEEFWSANLDPVTLASSEKGVNTSRNNNPLRFPPAPAISGTWTPTLEWGNFSDSVLDGWKTPRPSTHAFVARAIVYSTLTYPLISSDYGNAWKWTTFTERASPSPGGIIDYAKQFDRIVALATSPPKQWEVRIAARCWMRFRIVNPLTVSDQTRKALATKGHPLRKLLRARWEGRDLCGAECLRTLQTLVQQTEAST